MASRDVSQFDEHGACGSPPDAPKLCINNCGFFGTPQNNYLCSSCYKKSPPTVQEVTLSLSNCRVSDSQDVARGEPSVTCGQPSSTCPEPHNPDPNPALSSSSSATPPQKPNRCFSCRKRVGLTGFKCRCGNVFCSSHRYSDQHGCPFDYKAVARDAIAKANPVVKADKLNRI